MKCKRHPYEVGPGVCASCLRDRLLDVLAAQISLADTPRRRPEPILLPTSISPNRRSVDSAGPRHHLLFFSTPQVAPSSTATARRSRSFLSSLFSHPRSNGHHTDPVKSKRFGSISWFSALIPGRRRKNTKVSSPPPVRIACRDRGMSPAAEDDDDRDTASESGYSTEASGMSRRTMPTPMRGVHHHHRHRHGGGRFAICLSPLVRTSPAGRRCHASQAAEIGFSGELRPVVAHPRSSGVGVESFGPNRSRKLADFGRIR